MNKNTLIACATGVAVTIGAVIGISLWYNREQWDVDVAEATILELTDVYNAAIKEHPTDRAKAIFAFDLNAAMKRDEFFAAYGKYPEYTEWLKRFEAQAAHLRKALRKG